jgi:signal peptidase I
MTEVPIDRDPPSLILAKRSSRWKRATAAGVLSFVFAGMGQLYNRQPRKAFGLALITHLLDLLLYNTRLFRVFSTMITTVLVLALWKFFLAIEAAYTAAKLKKPEAPLPPSRLTYPALAVIFFVAAFFPSLEHITGETGFAAFKVPSASMCPTICLGERFVADMHAYKSRPPERGDIILMKHPSSGALFIKRVIGITGDRVDPGPGVSIFVNGQRFQAPAPCGSPASQTDDRADYSAFQSTTVPEGTFFVVGDNLANSFDSRIPEFGRVTSDMVRGKPLYLYWSPGKSRISCKLH